MNGLVTPSLLEQQVALTRMALDFRRGMRDFLASEVMPHLDCSVTGDAVDELMDYLDEERPLHAILLFLVDAARTEIRQAIEDGTSTEQVAIPRERLIGCAAAVETRKVLSPNAKALQAALPPIDRLYDAARNAVEFAEAIRESLWMIQHN
ncbi:MAG: hypothetical protein ACEPO2_22380 [Pelagibaca sp.]